MDAWLALARGGLKGVIEITTEGTQDPFSRFAKDFPEMYEVVRCIALLRLR